MVFTPDRIITHKTINRHHRDRQGFTLLEILVVIIVLGTVAGLAFPVLTEQMEKSRANEATTSLKAIYSGQKIYALNNGGNYWSFAGSPQTSTVNSALNLDLTLQFFDISSAIAGNAANPKTFSVTATRNSTMGGSNATQYRVDQTGTVTKL